MISYRYLLTLFLLTVTITVSGQIPVVKTPQPATLSTGVIVGQPNNRVNPTPNMPSFPNFNNNRYRQQQEMYERDRMEVERRNMEIQRMTNEALAGFPSIQYELPSCAGLQGTEHFYRTAEKLMDMLQGKIPMNLKDAVFSVENSYFEGQLDRKIYEERISEMVAIARSKAIQDGCNWNDLTVKNIMLYRVMADTLRVKLPGQEKTSVSFPMQYDFEDYRGEKDPSKLFVTKLLRTHTGQCHSMPLLYLILCEAAGTDAYMAFAPQHSYIKFKDKRNNWHNLELTNGKIVSDAFVTGSGYVNAAAVKHHIYMEPQTRKQVIAHCLSDLASEYTDKYGYDSFVIQCADSSLAYAPGNTSALGLKSNYHSARFEYTVDQVGRPPQDILKKQYPHIYELLEERNNFYRKMDEIGFVRIPEEIYERWLNSINGEKEKREHDIRYKNILRLIK
jgi:hypothetical protein